MVNNRLRFLCLFSGLILLAPVGAKAQVFVDLEGGLVLGMPYNEVRIPNQGGTTFDLSKGFTPKATPFYRIRPGITVGRRHTFTALYAPLTVEYKGAFDTNVNYNGQPFAAGESITARYTFNSYRLTYRFAVVDKPSWQVGVGFTGKIRDANIAIRSADRASNFSNLGFVPLLNFRVQYSPDERFALLLEGDALGAKQGRAEDVFVGGTWCFSDQWRLKGGYRVVEGGANSGEVYNFTWINYAALGIVWGAWK